MLKSYLRSQLFDAAGNDGADGGGGAAFDPAAFRTEMLGEFTRMFNGGLKALKTDLGKMIQPKASDAVVDPAADHATDPGTDGAKPKSDPATLRLQRQLEALQGQLATEKTAREGATKAASEKERLASIKDTLSGHQFATDGYRADAFRLFRDEIKLGEDGELYGGDNVPLKEYVAETLKQRADWAPVKDVGGAGARNGKTQSAGKAVDYDSIKMGMSAADVNAVAAEISAVLAGQR